MTTPHPPSSWPTSSLLLFPFPLHSSLPPGWCRVCSSAPAPRALFLSHRRQAAHPWTSAGLRPEDLQLDAIQNSFPCSMPESGLIQRKYVEEFLTNVLTSKKATDMVKSVLSKLVSGMLSLATTAPGSFTENLVEHLRGLHRLLELPAATVDETTRDALTDSLRSVSDGSTLANFLVQFPLQGTPIFNAAKARESEIVAMVAWKKKVGDTILTLRNMPNGDLAALEQVRHLARELSAVNSPGEKYWGALPDEVKNAWVQAKRMGVAGVLGECIISFLATTKSSATENQNFKPDMATFMTAFQDVGDSEVILDFLLRLLRLLLIYLLFLFLSFLQLLSARHQGNLSWPQELAPTVAAKCGSIEDGLDDMAKATAFLHAWSRHWAQGSFDSIGEDGSEVDSESRTELFKELSALCRDVPVLGKFCRNEEALDMYKWFSNWVAESISPKLDKLLMKTFEEPYLQLVEHYEKAKAIVESVDKSIDLDSVDSCVATAACISTYLEVSEAVNCATSRLGSLVVGGKESSRVQFLTRYHRCLVGHSVVIRQCKGGSTVEARDFLDEFAAAAAENYQQLESFRAWFSAAADKVMDASTDWEINACADAAALDRVPLGGAKQNCSHPPSSIPPAPPRPPRLSLSLSLSLSTLLVVPDLSLSLSRSLSFSSWVHDVHLSLSLSLSFSLSVCCSCSPPEGSQQVVVQLPCQRRQDVQSAGTGHHGHRAPQAAAG